MSLVEKIAKYTTYTGLAVFGLGIVTAVGSYTLFNEKDLALTSTIAAFGGFVINQFGKEVYDQVAFSEKERHMRNEDRSSY